MPGLVDDFGNAETATAAARLGHCITSPTWQPRSAIPNGPAVAEATTHGVGHTAALVGSWLQGVETAESEAWGGPAQDSRAPSRARAWTT